MRRIPGYLTNTSATLDEDRAGKDVVSYSIGDRVYLPAQDIYAKITGFRRSENPHKRDFVTFLTEVPSDPKFQAWCQKNPQSVKLLVSGWCELRPNIL